MTSAADDGRTHPLLLDGGMGEELRARSPAGDKPLWSAQVMIEAPEVVRAAHRAFIEAGAELIIANTYSTIRRKLRGAGIEDRFAELNRLAAALATEAREEARRGDGGRDVLIAGSLPPLHGSYRPDSVAPFDELEPAYREQAELLAPSVDLFLCETMSTAAEARAAAAGAAATGRPVWVAWTLADEPGPDGRARLRSGESVEQAVAALADLRVGGYLVNCCAPESVTLAIPKLVALAEAAGGRVVGGYANGFAAIPADWEIETAGAAALGAREDLDPETYLGHVRAWVEAGATAVGGCCRIGPAHIAAIRDGLATT